MLQETEIQPERARFFGQPCLSNECDGDNANLVDASLLDSHSTVAYEPHLKETVGYILDECFFGIGQAIGDRKTVDRAAVIWWRDRYEEKFLRKLQSSGNTWVQDRNRVIQTVWMLGNRAVFYAGDNLSIGLVAAMKASDDVERYCTLHAARRFRHADHESDVRAIQAGYYCTI